jgi:puromycin-sensitive aminopeptidase
VRYTDELLNRLRKPIESLELPPADRLGIEGDAFALARAGMLPTTHVLALLAAYKSEENYTVYSDLTANLGDLATIVSATDYYPTFSRYAASLFESVRFLLPHFLYHFFFIY